MKVNRDLLRRNEENHPEIAPENRDFIRFFYARSTNRIFNRLKRRFFCAQIAPFSLFSDTFINLVARQGLLHIFPTFIPQCGELTATSFAQSQYEAPRSVLRCRGVFQC